MVLILAVVPITAYGVSAGLVGVARAAVCLMRNYVYCRCIVTSFRVIGWLEFPGPRVTISSSWYGMVWYGMVDVYDGYLAAEASVSSFG